MQRVIHNEGYKHIHWLLDDIDTFYKETSDFSSKPHSLIPKSYDISFKKLATTFNRHSSMPTELIPSKFVSMDIKPLSLPQYNPKNVIICFSGGKDSIALAMKCKEDGFNVYLYSVEHINQSYVDETKIAREAAELLGLPIYVDDIRLGGKHDWMEHPMKNMVIANGALTYGITHGIGTSIWFGNYMTSYLDDNDFSRCAGDCVDMWYAYNEIIDRIIPGFEIHLGLSSMGETLSIVTPHKDIMNVSLSCLCRHSLRPYRWNWVKEKFGIELPRNRCGSCYKCCVEYMYMADHNLVEFNKEYYKYCFDKLYHVYLNEFGQTLDVNNVWYSYLFYDITESKAVEDLKHARLFIRNIKWGEEKIVKRKRKAKVQKHK